MQLTKEQIESINKEAPNEWGENEQGIFKQPNGIPIDEKEHVIYMRWLSSGMSGGNYHGDSASYFEKNKPEFEVLELVLLVLKPDLSFLQFRKLKRDIKDLIKTNSDTEREYYGNCSDFEIRYIPVSDLINYIEHNYS